MLGVRRSSFLLINKYYMHILSNILYKISTILLNVNIISHEIKKLVEQYVHCTELANQKYIFFWQISL